MAELLFDIDGASGVAVLELPHGGVVFVRGDRGEQAFVVRSGLIEIREGGQTVGTIGPGDMFGELALIDSGPRSASAVAVGETELIVIDRPTFDRLVRESPDFALNVMSLMARRLRAMLAAARPTEVESKVPAGAVPA